MRKIRVSTKRYVKEILHYCKNCGVLYTDCNVMFKCNAREVINPRTKKISYKDISKCLEPEHIEYYCMICCEEITDNKYLLPGNYLEFYHAHFPLKINLDKVNQRINSLEEEIESLLFEKKL